MSILLNQPGQRRRLGARTHLRKFSPESNQCFQLLRCALAGARRSGHRQPGGSGPATDARGAAGPDNFRIFAARASAELQRLHADAERRRTEEKYRWIIQTTDAGFVLLNPDFVVTDVNQRNFDGVERFCEVIRGHAAVGARDILAAVYTDIRDFTRGARQEDDITLLIAKVREHREPAQDYVI